MGSINAGEYDRLVKFMRKTTARDPLYNEESEGYEPMFVKPGSPTEAQLFAAKVDDALVGRAEYTRQDLVLAANQARISVRYMSGITSAVQIIVVDTEETIYNIISGPSEFGRKEGLAFLCERYSS